MRRALDLVFLTLIGSRFGYLNSFRNFLRLVFEATLGQMTVPHLESCNAAGIASVFERVPFSVTPNRHRAEARQLPKQMMQLVVNVARLY